MRGGKKAAVAEGKLAVVLTGNAGRAAALLGALQTLEEQSLTPDVVVGVSGGSVAGALYVACGGAAAARDALYDLVARKSWQDLADLDCDAVFDLAVRPHEVSGLLKGDALAQALLGSAVGHQGFGHLAKPLFVVATDLNSGGEVVFGPTSADQLGDQPAYRAFAATEATLDTVNVATACKASCAVPGLFQPVALEQLCLVDGTLRQRRALAVAAAQEGVGRILWLHAGLDVNDTFTLVVDYAGQSFAACALQALTVAAADSFDPHTADPALDGKAVRFLNLATAGIPAAELAKAQNLYESGRRSVAALLGAGELFGDAAALADALAAQTDEVDGARWLVTNGAAALAITDRTPAVQTEFGYEFDEYLGKAGLTKVDAREPIASALWAKGLAEAQVGVWGLCWRLLYRGIGFGCKGVTAALRTAWRAIGGDKGYAALARTTEQTVLDTVDKLKRKPQA